LSAEHLDYHSTMEDYFETKKQLFFLNAKKRTAIVNQDDAWGRRLIAELPLTTISYGLEPASLVRVRSWRHTESGIKAEITYPGGVLKICSRLLGKHNLYNILAAVASGLALNVPPDALREGIADLAEVPGRMQKIANGLGFHVFVDYAHTDVALRSLLEAVKELRPRRVLLVFGAGGDRDRGKRARMGEVAASLADRTFLTSDNPRSEDPLAILAEIERGFARSDAQTYTVIPDRRQAIETALSEAKKGDAVLIAGKGHENHQVLRDRVIPFDDAEVAGSILAAMEQET
ncbi:MAG: UDP-N-acetylmuramoyl-L-alanyl-D-glutamate--2,6-diaminopimelate ligase, partial [Candidatus Aminicenantes bacterium]|nr:UDP-N-acetylmuramoyl-L-alanyl-D-glutamate--2,6-diaminopimelate ligase [Candidatus Aminicenantes bacterium]